MNAFGSPASLKAAFAPDSREPAIDDLPVAPATSVKKEGWRGMMRALSAHGRLLVTNHNQPEAVILSMDEYTQLVQAAQRAKAAEPDPLAELRRQFDERLQKLQAPDANERLRNLMKKPAPLAGAVLSGSSY